MAIQSPKNTRVAPSKLVRNTISNFTVNHTPVYLLRTYIDENYWMSELQKSFGVTNIDNLTDFNYARCFTYLINEEDRDLSFGSAEFEEYLIQRGGLDTVMVSISALGPYALCEPARYRPKDADRNEDVSNEWVRKVEAAMLDFCTRNDLFVVSDADLQEKIEGIALELHGPNPNVYHLLFEDSAFDFPFQPLGAPPAHAGQQGKPVPGHNIYYPGRSQWPEGENGVRETQEAWVNGECYPNNTRIGRSSRGRRIRVHESKEGIHGYPIPEER